MTRSHSPVVDPQTSSYATLPEDFFARVAPTPVGAPRLQRLNHELARAVGLAPDWLMSSDGVSVLAGNRPFEGAEPIAMAYAGHQFGNFVPSLGDGRAVLIGEQLDGEGRRHQIQLKGSGPTPFSRSGDGRAAIGPVLREYVLSEAMFALGIPTTRALAMVTTGEPVVREQVEPGAILTRLSAGYVRVGTFEFFAARGMADSVRTLADYVIERSFPEASSASNPYVALLDRVIAAQADLIARWMLVGFVHGVMNTDNMSIVGETIDYGPCAFLDEHDPAKVFSSIDQMGRYAYRQQPNIGLWNLTRFAETLLPMLAESEEASVEVARASLARFAPEFQSAYAGGLLRKLGLRESNDANREVATQLLEEMAKGRADHTLTFRCLSDVRLDDPETYEAVRSLFDEREAFDQWAIGWRARLEAESIEDAGRSAAMRSVNPLFIPRNHRVQRAIDALMDEDDQTPLEDLLAVTSRPFEQDPDRSDYSDPPESHEVVRQTFCGT